VKAGDRYKKNPDRAQQIKLVLIEAALETEQQPIVAVTGRIDRLLIEMCRVVDTVLIAQKRIPDSRSGNAMASVAVSRRLSRTLCPQSRSKSRRCVLIFGDLDAKTIPWPRLAHGGAFNRWCRLADLRDMGFTTSDLSYMLALTAATRLHKGRISSRMPGRHTTDAGSSVLFCCYRRVCALT
jgi:hypothetical protein